MVSRAPRSAAAHPVAFFLRLSVRLTVMRARARAASGPALFRLPRRDPASLSSIFASRHYVRLPGFLPPATLRLLAGGLASAPFQRPLRTRATLRDISPALGAMVTFFLHHPKLFAFVGCVARTNEPRGLFGMLYRQGPAPHYVRWHRDTDYPPFTRQELTRATLVINLGGRYRGGILELRRPGRPGSVTRVPVLRAGDAVLFRNSLFHRSSPVLGARPKVSYVGWFSPDALDLSAQWAAGDRARRH